MGGCTSLTPATKSAPRGRQSVVRKPVQQQQTLRGSSKKGKVLFTILDLDWNSVFELSQILGIAGNLDKNSPIRVLAARRFFQKPRGIFRQKWLQISRHFQQKVWGVLPEKPAARPARRASPSRHPRTNIAEQDAKPPSRIVLAILGSGCRSRRLWSWLAVGAGAFQLVGSPNPRDLEKFCHQYFLPARLALTILRADKLFFTRQGSDPPSFCLLSTIPVYFVDNSPFLEQQYT